MDCLTGDLLCMASMPSFDPNSFSDGIGRVEWKMLSEDDHVPLRNKVLKGLYPPGSTVKPMVAMAFLEAGLDPAASVGCGGGLRVGNRVFHCWNRRGHGTVDMAKGIYQSCDVYFYHFAQQIGMDPIAVMAKRLGMEAEVRPAGRQPVLRHGPRPRLEAEEVRPALGDFRHGQRHDRPGLHAGQSAAAGGDGRAHRDRQPDHAAAHTSASARPKFESHGFSAEHVTYRARGDERGGQRRGHRRPGQAADSPTSRWPARPAPRRSSGLNISSGKGGIWKYRDHGLFIFFAPFDNPRYAGAVVIEHGGGSGSAYPIARDVMTFLFDPAKGMEALTALEAQWGGTAMERMAKKYAAAEQLYGTSAPKPADDAAVERAVEAIERPEPTPTTPQTAAASPAPEPVAAVPAPSPPRRPLPPQPRQPEMQASYVPALIARQPWRVILPLIALVLFGSSVLYSAAGGSLQPWAVTHLMRFGVFLAMALVIARIPARSRSSSSPFPAMSRYS